MAGVHRVEGDLRFGPRLDPVLEALDRDPWGAPPRGAAPGIGLKLERCHAHHVAVAHEEGHDLRDLVHIAVEDRGVEEHRERQPAGPLDVVQADSVEFGLRAVALAVLGHVHVEGHVHQAGLDQVLQQIPLQPDPVGEQRRLHTLFADPRHDLDQLGALAQGRSAAGHLDVRARAVEPGDRIDAPDQIRKRDVPHGLGIFREVAKRAIQVAALGDLQGHAADRPAPAHGLPAVPLAGGDHPLLGMGERRAGPVMPGKGPVGADLVRREGGGQRARLS
jgi:hypothetical protein